MAKRSRIDRSDVPAIWAVAAIGILAVTSNSIWLLPQIAGTVGGHRLLQLFAFQGVMTAVAIGMLCVALFLGWRAASAAPPGSVRRYLRALRVPIIFAVVSAAVFSFLDEQDWVLWISGGITIFIELLAGWIVGRQGYSIWKCASAGLILLVIAHLLLKGLAFALSREWQALGGVFVSFAMFGFVSMALAAVSGSAARYLSPSNPSFKRDALKRAP